MMVATQDRPSTHDLPGVVSLEDHARALKQFPVRARARASARAGDGEIRTRSEPISIYPVKVYYSGPN